MSVLKALQLALPLFFREKEYVAPAHAVVEGSLVRYTVRRSPRSRNISLRIDESGLRVGAPLHASTRAIEQVIALHGPWVREKLEEWAARRAPPPQWTDGAVFRLRGKPLTLRCGDDVTGAAIEGEVLLAPRRDPQGAVVALFKRLALAHFREQVGRHCDRLALPHPEVRLSSARSRWGSCHSAGRILLNWRMIQMPDVLSDYVAAHEVAHLREMNHSPRFWAIVGELVPDYRTLRRTLAREGHGHLIV
jgi:predicted metal-dependent hydrolase